MKVFAIAFGAVLIGVIALADSNALPRVIRVFCDFPGGDKLGHFLLMGGLAFFMSKAFPSPAMKIGGKMWPYGVVGVVILAVGEEFSQIFIPVRTFSLMDLVADFLGIWVFGGGVHDYWPFASRISRFKTCGCLF